jgi:phosphoglycolate phosphatase-like HAD superfamily hydrolase
MTYDLAIFDLETALADRQPVFLDALHAVGRKQGLSFDPPRVWLADRGAFALARLVSTSPLTRIEAAWQISQHVQHRPWDLFPSIVATLGFLRRAGVRLALVSTERLAHVADLLGPVAMDLFDVVEAGVRVRGRGRCYRRIARGCSVRGYRTIVVSRRLRDARAAHAQGMSFGAAAWGNGLIERVWDVEPDELFAEVAELRRLTPLWPASTVAGDALRRVLANTGRGV